MSKNNGTVFRVKKDKNFTVMSNHHLRNKELSLRTKGLLSHMLSLPEDWDFTTEGLIAINKDGRRSIETGLKELEEHGYLTREQERAGGKFGRMIYTIYEIPPQARFLQTEKPRTRKPQTENVQQISTKELSTKETNTKVIKESTKERNIIPPTLEMVSEYCQEENIDIDAQHFYDYYTSNNWKVGRNKMKDWQATVRNWERRQYGNKRKKAIQKVRDNKQDEIKDVDLPEEDRQAIIDRINQMSDKHEE